MTHLIAIARRAYDTWRMRMALSLLMLAAAAFLPLQASAFDLEENLRAQHPQYQGPSQLHIAQSGCKTLSQAIESVRNRTGGRVVNAETKVQGGREVHYIKVLTEDGKVKTHKVNGCRV